MILNTILIILHTSGGTVRGTTPLYDLIPASERSIRYAIQQARQLDLIASTSNQGGRGRLAIHRLTKKGIEYVQSK